ncbi:ribosomal protein S18-alanine N-acetyltransferase [Candidatus Bathyarchaeota archaeon]|nr:ribosomal protein S18-alanine N-acetyltransferase [Candidatus Bathyarchaeota archaeon]
MVTMQKFIIRRFNPSDLNAVIEINRRCLPENYTFNFFMDIYRNCPEAFLVAEAEDKIVGYIMCRIEYGFSDFNRFKLVKKGHIVSIAVLNEYRGKGIGTSLITQALKELVNAQAKECYLEVRVSNEAGINLYRKLGFEVAQRIVYYYHDGEDAYVMSRKL